MDGVNPGNDPGVTEDRGVIENNDVQIRVEKDQYVIATYLQRWRNRNFFYGKQKEQISVANAWRCLVDPVKRRFEHCRRTIPKWEKWENASTPDGGQRHI